MNTVTGKSQLSTGRGSSLQSGGLTSLVHTQKTVGSLFAGVEGFGLGAERVGCKVLWQVEKDAKCQSVNERHFPSARRYYDVRECGKHNLEPVDIICGGFPCQDLSVAGKRKGLAGERSGLFFEAVRIASELRAKWIVLENVAGLLSSNEGRDFGTVLWTLAELGYGLTYRVLDSQFFGVPQRRRRVFIVGCLGGICPPEILFEPGSLSVFPAEDSAAEVDDAWDIAGTLDTRGGARGGCHWSRLVIDNGRVRDQTPLECERMQGFPDFWTKWDAAGREFCDGVRYAMMGNAVSVPVAEWIFKRLVATASVERQEGSL